MHVEITRSGPKANLEAGGFALGAKLATGGDERSHWQSRIFDGTRDNLMGDFVCLGCPSKKSVFEVEVYCTLYSVQMVHLAVDGAVDGQFHALGTFIFSSWV